MPIAFFGAAGASKRLRLGMVGGGQGAFIGALHRMASRMDTADLFRRSSHGRAVADLRLVTVADGPGTGGRLLEVRTPSAFAADIAHDRGGELLRLSWKGREVGWHSAAMAPYPWSGAEVERGLGFLRGFDGSLVTCGLDHHGVPAETSAEAARTRSATFTCTRSKGGSPAAGPSSSPSASTGTRAPSPSMSWSGRRWCSGRIWSCTDATPSRLAGGRSCSTTS